MKVELHLHTTRYSGCAVATPTELMERMVQVGYQAVFITEHDAVWSDWEISQLQSGHPLIRIFPGVELTVGSDPIRHLLVLGANDPSWLRMRDAADVLARATDEGHLTILAHPFRWAAERELLAGGVLPDALEHLTANHDAVMADSAGSAARRHDLPLVNAGDVHDLSFLNRYWIETDRPIERADDIRPAILNRAYVNCVGQ